MYIWYNNLLLLYDNSQRRLTITCIKCPTNTTIDKDIFFKVNKLLLSKFFFVLYDFGMFLNDGCWIIGFFLDNIFFWASSHPIRQNQSVNINLSVYSYSWTLSVYLSGCFSSVCLSGWLLSVYLHVHRLLRLYCHLTLLSLLSYISLSSALRHYIGYLSENDPPMEHNPPKKCA